MVELPHEEGVPLVGRELGWLGPSLRERSQLCDRSREEREGKDQVENKLDGVGPVDNRPSPDKLHHFVKKNKKQKKCDT